MEKFRSLTSEVAINLAGRATAAIISVLMVPLYARILGLESYGLLGFYNFLIAFSGALDIGLPTAINRVMASSLGRSDSLDRQKNLRAFEALLWAIALLIFLISPALSHYGATNWIQPGSLSILTVKISLLLSLLSLGLRFPIATYQGALYGLRRHMTVNLITTLFLVARHGVSIAALVFISKDIRLFFIVQAVFSGLEVAVSAFAAWRATGGGALHTKVEFFRISNIRHFLGELTVISLAAAFLNHSDKLVLSRYLPLDKFSLYSICASIALGLYTLSYPVFNAAYPRLTSAFNEGPTKLKNEFYLQFRVVNLLVLPVAAVLLTCPQTILSLWSGSDQSGSNSYLYLVGLTIGVTLSCMAVIPHALLLAVGRPRPILIFNIFAALFCVPAFLFSAKMFPIAIPFIWAAIHFAYLCTVLPVAYIRCFGHGTVKWWLTEVMPPLVICFSASLFMSRLNLGTSFIVALGAGFISFLLILCVLLALYRDIRIHLISTVSGILRRANVSQ